MSFSLPAKSNCDFLGLLPHAAAVQRMTHIVGSNVFFLLSSSSRTSASLCLRAFRQVSCCRLEGALAYSTFLAGEHALKFEGACRRHTEKQFGASSSPVERGDIGSASCFAGVCLWMRAAEAIRQACYSNLNRDGARCHGAYYCTCSQDDRGRMRRQLCSAV